MPNHCIGPTSTHAISCNSALSTLHFTGSLQDKNRGSEKGVRIWDLWAVTVGSSSSASTRRGLSFPISSNPAATPARRARGLKPTERARRPQGSRTGADITCVPFSHLRPQSRIAASTGPNARPSLACSNRKLCDSPTHKIAFADRRHHEVFLYLKVLVRRLDHSLGNEAALAITHVSSSAHQKQTRQESNR